MGKYIVNRILSLDKILRAIPLKQSTLLARIFLGPYALLDHVWQFFCKCDLQKCDLGSTKVSCCFWVKSEVFWRFDPVEILSAAGRMVVVVKYAYNQTRVFLGDFRRLLLIFACFLRDYRRTRSIWVTDEKKGFTAFSAAGEDHELNLWFNIKFN